MAIFALHGQMENTGVFKNAKKAKTTTNLKQQNKKPNYSLTEKQHFLEALLIYAKKKKEETLE